MASWAIERCSPFEKLRMTVPYEVDTVADQLTGGRAILLAHVRRGGTAKLGQPAYVERDGEVIPVGVGEDACEVNGRGVGTHKVTVDVERHLYSGAINRGGRHRRLGVLIAGELSGAERPGIEVGLFKTS